MGQTMKQKDSCSMDCNMEVYQKLATLGAPHKLLASRVGSWKTKSKFWMEGDKPPMESSGTCERKMILGGRFLQEDFVGEMMGGPFTGIGLTGYDNNTKKYVSTWMDSMSTGICKFEGKGSEDGKTITLEGHFNDPVKGDVKWHSATKVVDDKTELFNTRMTSKGGKEEKFEIVYTRK